MHDRKMSLLSFSIIINIFFVLAMGQASGRGFAISAQWKLGSAIFRNNQIRNGILTQHVSLRAIDIGDTRICVRATYSITEVRICI